MTKMLNPYFIMNCLNVDAQINLEIVNYLVNIFLCPSLGKLFAITK